MLRNLKTIPKLFPWSGDHHCSSLPLPAPAPTQPPDAVSLSNRILREDAETLPSTLNAFTQWTPDLVQAVLKRLWNHGPKALQFFNHLDRHPSYAHSAAAFDHAIDIAARMRDYRTLWKLVARMQARRLGPGPKTFSIITERYVSAGKADKALKVFLSMHKHGCPHDLSCFNSFLDVLCKSKRPEMAYRLMKMLRGKFKPDTVTYNILANGFCLIKQTPKAQDILKEMIQRGLNPTMTTYNTMLKGFLRAGQVKEAWGFFLQMKKRKCEIDVVTYTTMVHGFGVAGDVDKAQKVFNEMVGKGGVLPSVATYNALIQVLCKKDSMENAVLAFDEMLRKGYVPNTMTYNVVIRGLCHRGRTDEAFGYLDKMRKSDDGCEPSVQTYNVIIRYYCDEGEHEKALEVFEKMNSGEYCLPNLDTYNVLISSMFVRKKSHDLLVAGRLIVEMVGRGFLPRRFTFNRVLNGLLLTGNQEFAREILRLVGEHGCLPRHFKL
ncbi:hypothetical protein DM860_001355 [Cuscuta australis]|uniref:Pentacotripeptide-repeat region of PRORP domain-containing protein n=1 Tax=Cuscuta australis TaxID=267555 RepID=A0A328DTJ2_9ASTE|nr:hypothetical protein DM860_001355 [Cuscuta australis]